MLLSENEPRQPGGQNDDGSQHQNGARFSHGEQAKQNSGDERQSLCLHQRQRRQGVFQQQRVSNVKHLRPEHQGAEYQGKCQGNVGVTLHRLPRDVRGDNPCQWQQKSPTPVSSAKCPRSRSLQPSRAMPVGTEAASWSRDRRRRCMRAPASWVRAVGRTDLSSRRSATRIPASRTIRRLPGPWP